MQSVNEDRGEWSAVAANEQCLTTTLWDFFWFLEQDVILLVRENGTFPYSIRGQFPSLAEDEYHLLDRDTKDGESDVPEEEEGGKKGGPSHRGKQQQAKDKPQATPQHEEGWSS